MKTLLREGQYASLYCLAPNRSGVFVNADDWRALCREQTNLRPQDVGKIGWPIKFGVSSSLDDTITPQSKQFYPHHIQKVQFRIWAFNKKHATALKHIAYSLTGKGQITYTGGYVDGGETLNFTDLATDIRHEASRLNIQTFNNKEMEQRLIEDEIAKYLTVTSHKGKAA